MFVIAMAVFLISFSKALVRITEKKIGTCSLIWPKGNTLVLKWGPIVPGSTHFPCSLGHPRALGLRFFRHCHSLLCPSQWMAVVVEFPRKQTLRWRWAHRRVIRGCSGDQQAWIGGGKDRSRQKEKSNCDILSMEASASPARNSENRKTLQNCPEWGRRARCLHPHIGQSLEGGCPEEAAWPGAKWFEAKSQLLPGRNTQ